MLSGSFIGTFKTRVSQVQHTSSGRELRRAGIELLCQSIKETGWLKDSIPVATLVDSTQERVIKEASVMDILLRLVDGNHRIAALRAIDDEGGTDSEVLVSVYSRFETSMERAIADRKLRIKSRL